MLECSYQELNITLVFQDEAGDLVSNVDVSSTPHLHFGIIDETLAVYLKGNKIYSVQLQVEAYSHTLETNKYYFSMLISR